jgi:hypothetical protein
MKRQSAMCGLRSSGRRSSRLLISPTISPRSARTASSVRSSVGARREQIGPHPGLLPVGEGRLPRGFMVLQRSTVPPGQGNALMTGWPPYHDVAAQRADRFLGAAKEELLARWAERRRVLPFAFPGRCPSLGERRAFSPQPRRPAGQKKNDARRFLGPWAAFFVGHAGRRPEARGEKSGPHPNPLPAGEGTECCPHPNPNTVQLGVISMLCEREPTASEWRRLPRAFTPFAGAAGISPAFTPGSRGSVSPLLQLCLSACQPRLRGSWPAARAR